MPVGSSKSDQTAANSPAKQTNESDKASHSAKQQPDGSKVSTPPSDPANSDSTLQRNKDGNS